MSKCPDASTLINFVSGYLDESTADSLAVHIEECADCQQFVDARVSEPDTFLKVARKPHWNQAESDSAPELAKLIAQAEQLTPQQSTSSTISDRKRTSSTVTLNEFVDRLRKSSLINWEETEFLLESLNPTTSDEFAQALVEHNRLTAFQIRAIMRGRWKGLVMGNYVILDKLGQGGMGSVYRARHKRLGRVVCIKVMHRAGRKSPQHVERFRREAMTVGALKHPNIVVAHDADESHGIPFLVMELIQGSNLAAHIRHHRSMNNRKAAEIIQQVARALEYAHSKGIVHRDIKPHNLLLQDSGDVKILDMGLARFDAYLSNNPDATTQTTMTNSGQVMGTVDYMSPEQALNSRHADHRSDIYSLGCTLYFTVTGEVLYDGETVMEKLLAHREAPLPLMDRAANPVPPGLDAILHHMIAKKPEDRYDSMSAVAEDLDRFLRGEQPLVLKTPEPPRLSLSPAVLGRTCAAILFVIAASCLGYWSYLEWKASQPIQIASQERPDRSGVRVVDESTTQRQTNTPTQQNDKHSARPDANDDTDVKPNTVVRRKHKSAPGKTEPKSTQASHANTRNSTAFKASPGGNGPDTGLREGLQRRALIVVAYRNFNGIELSTLRKSLGAQGVEIVIGSSCVGKATPMKTVNGPNDPVEVELDIEHFTTQTYDTVIFCGGDVGEFRSDGLKAAIVRELIYESLKNARPVGSIGNGKNILRDSGIFLNCSFGKNGEVQVGELDSMPGTILIVHNYRATQSLVEAIWSMEVNPEAPARMTNTGRELFGIAPEKKN